MDTPGSNTASNYRHIAGAWAVLMTLTAVQLWMGSDQADFGAGFKAAASAILVVSFVKVYIVGHSFMELRRAAPFLRLIYATWCVAMCAILILFYVTV